MCNASVHVKMHVQMQSTCIDVNLFSNLSLYHANVQTCVQCTQVCVDAISGCARVIEMQKGASMGEHVRM